MQKTIGLVLAIVGGVLAAAMFIVMAAVNFKTGGVVTLMTAIVAALFALMVVPVSVQMGRDKRCPMVLNGLLGLLALVLITMLPTMAISMIPFWVAVAILFIAAGRQLGTGESLNFSDKAREEVVLTVPDVVMIAACAVGVVFILVGLITAPVKMKAFPKVHLLNTILLLLVSLGATTAAVFSLIKRSLVECAAKLMIAVALLALTETVGLYGFNGFVVIFAGVGAATAGFIDRQLDASEEVE